MENQVINSVSLTIDWVKECLMDEKMEWEDARALSLEFKEWLDSDEIDLIYLDKLD